MTLAELLLAKLSHMDGLYEQGVPVDALVSLVEAAEVIESLDPDWTHRDPESVYGIARQALTALREALEEK